MENSDHQEIKPEVNVNTYRKANVFMAEVLQNTCIVDLGEFNQINHITLSLADGENSYCFHEGQSLGVIAEGQTDEGKPHAVRLYSIASVSPLTNKEVKTLDLCVKRVAYIDENSGQKIKGVASNYLCDAAIGSRLACTGPAGRHFVLPQDQFIHRNYIFIATGTGIAPFRAFIEKLLKFTPNYNGVIYLYFGVQTQNQLLYDQEFRCYDPQKLRYRVSLSREQKNKDGGRMYVHDKITEDIEELWPILHDDNTIIYMCGLKGMEDGFEKTIKNAATQKGLDAESFWQNLQTRFEKEVY